MQQPGSNQTYNPSTIIFFIAGIFAISFIAFFAFKDNFLSSKMDTLEDIEAPIVNKVNKIIYEVQHMRSDFDHAIKTRDMAYINESRQHLAATQQALTDIGQLEETTRLDADKLSQDIATYQLEAANFVQSIINNNNANSTQQHSTNLLLSWQQLESDLHNFHDFSSDHLTKRLYEATLNTQKQQSRIMLLSGITFMVVLIGVLALLHKQKS